MAAITFADTQIGKILDAVDRQDLWHTTTVMLWSDHGWSLGAHDEWRKLTLWEDTNSVNLIVADPEVGAPGTSVTTPVSLLDIWPTLATLTGTAAPEGLDGVDLTGLMDGKGGYEREGVLSHLYASLSLRTEDWRFTVYHSGEIELYDPGADRFNHYDLSEDPAHAETIEKLHAVMGREAARLGLTIVRRDAEVTGTDDADIFIVRPGGRAVGGAGDDVYYLTDGSTLTETADGGHDAVSIVSQDDYLIPAHVEALILAETFSGVAHGDERANVFQSNGAGHDIFAGAGDDTVDGGGGHDDVFGADGDDSLIGGHGRDRLDGGEGRDVLYGGSGADRLKGRAGDDTLVGGSGGDRLNGGPGTDILEGGAAADLLYGGHGFDLAVYKASPEAVDVSLAHGTAAGGEATGDRLLRSEGLQGSAFGDVLAGNGRANFLNGRDGDDRLFGASGDDALVGRAGADLVIGNAGADRLWGGLGNDRLFGGRGDDRLDGGRDFDILAGRAGADVFVFSDGGDHIKDFCSAEGDRVDLSTLSIEFAALTLVRQYDETAVLQGDSRLLTIRHCPEAELDAFDFLF